VVTELATSLGLQARPHGVRHAAITEFLRVSNGNVRAAQRFSRHANLATLQVYDDNRTNIGAEFVAQLAAAMPGLDDEGEEWALFLMS
jgi:integrase/recombinase XerC